MVKLVDRVGLILVSVLRIGPKTKKLYKIP
jgi:hypothetical protein